MAIFYDSIWFCGDTKTKDWMASLFIDDGKWTCEYRFRYYDEAEPDKVWDSADRKSWYKWQAQDASDETLARMREALKALSVPMSIQMGGQPVDVVELQCKQDDAKFFFELASRKWAHVKHMSNEEYEKQHGPDGSIKKGGA